MADTPDLGKMWKQLTDTVGNGVSDVFTKLKNSSIADQVQSWIGKGENKPVTADQVSEALGPDRMDKIAKQTGKTPEQAAQTMADKLPGMVDKLSPDGHLPDPQTIKANMPGMPTPATAGASASAASGAGPAEPPRRTPQSTPRPPQSM
ncbi:YidB family protein [Catenulispora subtropica]|uniref:DUF937 domain-containing protein n=1 Tax=Catenulispora subtropica TaxID=450798 RepID=A0ABP5ETY3_9ACTN